MSQTVPLPERASPVAVSPATLDAMAITQRWVRVLALMSWIAISLMGLAALGLMASSLPGKDPRQVSTFPQGIALLVSVLVQFYPTLKLSLFAKHCGQLLVSRSVHDLEEALAEQRRLWIFAALLGLAYVAFGLVAFLAAFTSGG